MKKLFENLFEALLAELLVAAIVVTTGNKVSQLLLIALGTLVSGTIAFTPRQSDSIRLQSTNKKSLSVSPIQSDKTLVNFVFWIQWVLTGTTANLAGVILVSNIFGKSKYAWNTTLILGSLIPLISIGLIAGLLGWLILRQQIQNAWIWIPANLIGYTIAGITISVSMIIQQQTTIIFYTALGLTGLSIGIIQWWVLKNDHRNAVWCIPANILDWIISIPLIQLIYYLFGDVTNSLLSNEIVYATLLGLSRSLISSIILVIVLRSDIKEHSTK